MKTRILLFPIALIMMSSVAFSQVAINGSGADPHGSAALDISATDKGILIPRVNITDVDSDLTPVESPAEGLLVYNNSGGVLPAGFYYWSGHKWQQVIHGASVFSNDQLGQMYEAAELYEKNTFGSAVTIALPNSSNFYGWTNASEGETFGETSTDISNTTADRIIVGEDGLYEVEVSASFGGSNNAQIIASIFHTPLNASAVESRIGFLRKLSSNGDLGSASTHGLIRLEAGDALDIRFRSTSNGEEIDIYTLNFIVNKVGN